MDSSPDVEFIAQRRQAIATIKALMEYWGLTPDDLDCAPACESTPELEAALPPLYRHPVSGDTWDGRHGQPDWLRQALLKEGYTVEELRVKDEAP